MLNSLLENKSKSKVLGFFAVSPERGFFLPELKKKIGKAGKIQNELNSLIKEQILLQYQKKGAKYFRLNKKSQYYDQLKIWAKKLKLKTQDDLSKMLKKMPGIKMAVLSGIFVNGQKAECDALLVGKLTKRQLEKFERETKKIIGQEVNYAVMEHKEYKMRKDTFDRFMKDIFDNDHVILIDKTK